ncbi:MAG: hypothetical protein WC239_12400 [Sphaerochaetaceae bacterium]|jgi:RNA-directed DNA polymerase
MSLLNKTKSDTVLIPYECEILQSIRNGEYTPKPVRRVEIPKPDGGKRLLGIPTVVDREIQQAIAQVLTQYMRNNSQTTVTGFALIAVQNKR